MILQRVMTSAQISKRDRHEAMIRAGWRAALAAAPPSAPAPAGDLADAIAANAGVLHATIATLTDELAWAVNNEGNQSIRIEILRAENAKQAATIATLTAERNEAISVAMIRHTDVVREGKTILDFHEVWMSQYRDRAERAEAENETLRATIAALTEERDKAHKDMRESLDRWNKANGESNDDFMLLSDKHTLMTDRAERAEAECAKLRGVVRGIVDTYDNYRRRGVAPAPAEYVDVVKAIDAARAEEKA